MIPLLPYIPKDTDGVSNATWKKGYLLWIAYFTELLECDNQTFVKQVTANELAAWIQTLLQSQLDHGTVNTQLLHLVFLVYVRLGECLSVDSTSPLIAVDVLNAFSLVYARTNPRTIKTLFLRLFACQKGLQDQYEAGIDQLIDTLDTMSLYMTSTVNGELTLERILVVVRLLEAKIICLNARLPRVLTVIVTCYERLLEAADSSKKNNDEITVYSNYWLYLVKQSLVHIFDATIENSYLAPLEAADQRDMNTEAMVLTLSDHILQWIENSGLDAAKTVFVDAPLIMDWQVECQVAKRLERINQDIFQGENEQLSFLALVLQSQVQDLASGTSEWDNCIKKQNSKQQEEEKEVNISVSATEATRDAPQRRSSLISRVGSIFPDLGEGFIDACLAANNDDTETVIMQLLDDNLPPHLVSLDRTLQIRPVSVAKTPSQTNILDSRKNIFDKDEFDVFAGGVVQHDRVYLGKKSHGTADTLLKTKVHSHDDKTAMLRRIYDMYEDEIDDTYDSVNETTGAIDVAAVDDDGDAALDVIRAKKQQTVDPGILHESELVHMYVDHPQVYDRSSATRKSAQRDALRKRTNMTDEQLEGWAIMFNRNPRKQRILDKYMLFDGTQDQVDESVKSKQQTAPSPSKISPAPLSETKQRAYKSKNKAKVGNHNRKRNHDKKLAKLAGPPPNS